MWQRLKCIHLYDRKSSTEPSWKLGLAGIRSILRLNGSLVFLLHKIDKLADRVSVSVELICVRQSAPGKINYNISVLCLVQSRVPVRISAYQRAISTVDSGHESGHTCRTSFAKDVMSRSINRLSAREVVTLKTAGRHADGGGLYLRITDAGSRSWVFMTSIGGRRSEIGLGSVLSVSLATARRISAEMREAVATGKNPRSVIEPVIDAPTVPSFGKFSEDFIKSVESGWRNPVHRHQWRQSLRDHAAELTDMAIDQIGTDDVLRVLQPIWLTLPETAKRVRGRIERILDAAKVRGHRSRDSINPATWRGHLALLLPQQSKLSRGHHAALPWATAPDFMTVLREREAIASKCLQFVILTAARSGEALNATWSEIEIEKALWTVPAARMKAGTEHCVPLSKSAVKLLSGMRGGNANNTDLVFAVRGAVRSNMAMAMLLRRMNFGHVTVHGFRSTFRDWAGDATNYPRELVEQALAHTIQNKAERAYRRGTAIEKRRDLMESWDKYLNKNQ